MHRILFSGFLVLLICCKASAQTFPKQFSKISKLSGGLPAGLVDNGAAFGIESAVIGDLNDDGILDLAVGATNQGGFIVGAVFILFMNENGTVASAVRINNSEPASDADSFGSSVCGLGDLDGDGIEDIGVGAGYDSDGGFQAGAFWILFLRKDGSVKTRQKISKLAGNFSAPLVSGNVFGTGCANIGDLDGDGVVDVAVGARVPGVVYLLFLNKNGTVKNWSSIANGTGGIGVDSQGLFGYGLASLGDVNGDGIQDIAIGGHRTDVNNVDSGVVFVVFLTRQGNVQGFTKISNGLASFNDASAQLLGVSIAGIGDYNGDGVRDMVVGGTDRGDNTGAIWYMMLTSSGTVKSFYKISSLSGNSNLSLQSGDFFGGSICNLGDLNHDGQQDLAIGAFSDNDGGSDSGAIWISISCSLKGDAGPDQNICTTDAPSFVLNASLPTGSTGTWTTITGSAQFSDIHSPTSKITVLSKGVSKFTWTVQKTDCDAGRDTLKVSVGLPLTASISMPDSVFTCDNTAKLTAAQPPDGATGLWSVVKGNAVITDPTQLTTDISLNEKNKPVDIVWKVTNAACPAARDTVTLTSYALNTKALPNVITPNHDGKNEYWIVSAADQAPSDVKLYNRWGELVFSASNYKNNWSGAGLVSGVYYYHLSIPGCSLQVKGSLTIIH